MKSHHYSSMINLSRQAREKMDMLTREQLAYYSAIILIGLTLTVRPAHAAGSFMVQCPDHTDLHPLVNGQPNPGIKCQGIAGGDAILSPQFIHGQRELTIK